MKTNVLSNSSLNNCSVSSWHLRTQYKKYLNVSEKYHFHFNTQTNNTNFSYTREVWIPRCMPSCKMQRTEPRKHVSRCYFLVTNWSTWRTSMKRPSKTTFEVSDIHFVWESLYLKESSTCTTNIQQRSTNKPRCWGSKYSDKSRNSAHSRRNKEPSIPARRTQMQKIQSLVWLWKGLFSEPLIFFKKNLMML